MPEVTTPPRQRPHRKALRRRENPFDERFITFSAFRRLPLLSNAPIMGLLAARFRHARRMHGMRLYAWVIMPEHVHLLVRAEGAPWSALAKSIKGSVSGAVLARWRRLKAPVLERITIDAGRARFWQHGGGFDRNVRGVSEFCRFVRYMHRNPVERGLVEKPEDWKWSSVRWWMGTREGELECDVPPWKGLAAWKGYV